MRISLEHLRRYCPAVPADTKVARDLLDDVGIEVKRVEDGEGGPFFVTRATMLCQSIGWTSTLKPARSSCALATGGSCLMAPRSVGWGITTGVPS